MIKPIYDRSEWWAGWAAAQIGVQPQPPYYAIGFVDHDSGKPLGACVFNDYTGQNVEMSVAGLWSRDMFRIAYDHCFNELKVQRVTVRTRPDKKKVIKVITRMGFREEGRARSYYPDGSDALCFGMLPHEFALLPQTQNPPS